jgi:Beta-1,3-glucanase
MKDFSRRDAIKLGAGALAAASLPNLGRAKPVYGTNNIGLPLIPFTITNQTGKDLYWYIFGTTAPGSNPQVNNYYVSDLDGNCKEFPPMAGLKSYSVKLGSGTKINANYPQLPGGRTYFSLEKGLSVLNTNATGVPNAIVPNDSTDPNLDVLWDFYEMTWIGYSGPPAYSVLDGNPTQVNAFALAFQITLNGAVPGFPKEPSPPVILGFGSGDRRAKIFAEIEKAGPPWSNLIVPSPTPGGAPLRVLQPYYSIVGNAPGSGFPKAYLHNYIHNVILPYYDEQKTNRLTYVGPENNIWTGFTSGGEFIFKPNKGNHQPYKTQYTFPTINTEQSYGNTGYFGNPNDGVSQGIAAVLEASICRSTLGFYPGFPVPQSDRNLYYTKPPIFEYASIIHKYALDNHAFCFQQDEVANDAGLTNQVWNPTGLDVVIRPIT